MALKFSKPSEITRDMQVIFVTAYADYGVPASK